MTETTDPQEFREKWHSEIDSIRQRLGFSAVTPETAETVKAACDELDDAVELIAAQHATDDE